MYLWRVPWATVQQSESKEGQSVQPSKNVTIHSEVNAPPNGQPSSSSIQKNAASTSGHMKGNYQDDDSSRSSTTTDSLRRYFGDESDNDSSSESTGSSTSDDSEADDDDNDKKNESGSDDDSSDPDYVCPSPNIPSKSLKRSHHEISTKHCKPTATERRLKCPRCNQRFATSTNLDLHYREKHHQQKPFYCKWFQCDVVLARRDNLFYHIAEKHLNNRSENAQNGQRKTSAPKDSAPRGLLKSRRVKRSGERIGQMACPKCKRNLPSESHLQIHLHTHKRPGFRCAWLKCGFFYSKLSKAKDHVYADHLQVELANSQLLNRHLVKVNPRTNKLKAEKVRHKRSLNSTGRSRSRQLSTSSSESSSSKSSSSDSNRSSNSDNVQTDQIKCPLCEKTYKVKNKLVRHYRLVHQEWKPYYCRWPKCHFASGVYDAVVHHTNRKHFNSQNRQKARKYVGKRDEVPPNDPVLRQIGAIKFGRVKKANY